MNMLCKFWNTIIVVVGTVALMTIIFSDIVFVFNKTISCPV